MRRMFLASEMYYPVNMKRWGEFLGGFAGKRCVCIPSGMNGSFSTGVQYGTWKYEDSTNKALQETGMEIDYLILEEIGEGVDLKKRLIDCDTLFVMPGAAAYIMYWVLRRKLDLIINDVIDSGVVYAGSSAGSMILSKSLNVAEIFPGEPERGARYLPGLGLLDFDILPHYIEGMDLDLFKKQYIGNKVYFLKNEEAITVVGGKVTVLGEERIYSSIKF
jgi:dipeptidase E